MKYLLHRTATISALILITYLLIQNLFYTSMVISTKFPILTQTPLVSYGLLFVIFTIFLLFVVVLFRIKKHRHQWMVFISLNLIGLMTKWIIATSFTNSLMADNWNVIDSANKWLIQDPSITWPGAYLSTFQSQISLVLLYSPLAKFFGYSSQPYYLFTAVLIQISIGLLGLTILRYKDIKAANLVVFSLLLFLPNTWMSYFVYGDALALFFLSLAWFIWGFKESIRPSHRWLLYSSLYTLLGLAYCARTVAGIFILALSLYTLFSKIKITQKVLLSLTLLSLLILPIKVGEFIYSLRLPTYLYEFNLPSNSFLRIGLSENTWNQSPGFYDVQVYEDFESLYFHRNEMEILNAEVIKNRLLQLSNPSVAAKFFSTKSQLIWTDPDFETIASLYPLSDKSFDEIQAELYTQTYGSGAPDVKANNSLASFIQESFWAIRAYEKGYYLILISLFLGVLLKSRKIDSSLLVHIFIIGLFLYFSLFEIKSRYLWLFINFAIPWTILYGYDTLKNGLRKFNEKTSRLS